MLIHIGYHKTGTTWLQDHVFKNPSKGFVSRWTVQSGEAIEYFILKHPLRYDPNEVRLAFQKSYGDAADVCPVISHEDLCGYPNSGRFNSVGFNICERMHQAFPDAKVLIVVREQKSMLLSLYREYIRADGEASIEGFLGTGQERTGYPPVCRLDRLEYHLLVSRYMELFGRDKVLVLPYEFLRGRPTWFEQQIHDFCGTGVVANQSLTPRNVGWLGVTLGLRRKLNRFVHLPPRWDGEWQGRPLIHRLSFRFCDAFDRLVPMRLHRAADERLKRFIAARVADYYADSNRQLAEILGIDLRALGYQMPARTAGDLPSTPIPTTGTIRAAYAGFTEAPWSEHEPGRANVPS